MLKPNEQYNKVGVFSHLHKYFLRKIFYKTSMKRPVEEALFCIVTLFWQRTKFLSTR